MENKTVIIYPNAENDTDFKMAWNVTDIFENNGWNTVHCAYPKIPDLTGAGMLVTFGGDGTILHAARAVADKGIPILGINMGGKGFIAELEPGDTGLIEKAAQGQFNIEKRMMIDIEIIRNGVAVTRDFALNDAVIKGNNKVIEMNVFADGQRITGFSGDGTIIATPTGSTAYSMSAGGPIVEPTADNIIVTPICAHILEAKSFVLTSNRVVTIDIQCKNNHNAYLSADGGDHIQIIRGDCIKVSRSARTANLIYLSNRNFYNRLSEKLISRGI